MERYRRGIDRVEMLGCILRAKAGMEMRGRNLRDIMEAMIVYINSAFTLQMLEECPPDYQEAFKACREESGKLLDRVRTEKMDDVQFSKAYKEYCVRCHEINAPLVEKYRLNERRSFLFEPVLQRMVDLDREERIELLQRMRDDLIAGRLELPGENGEMDDHNRGWR